MTVVHKPFVIVDIVEMQKAEINILGRTVSSNPSLDMYQIKAVLKSYIEKTKEGRKILEKLGHGDKLTELEQKYFDMTDAFTASIPVTHQTLNWNKYHVGGEIMIAYYPTTVYGDFKIVGEENEK